MRERVATYVMDDVLYDVYACYNASRNMDLRDVAFYDIYNQKTGRLLNKNDPWYSFPTWEEVFNNYYKAAV